MIPHKHAEVLRAIADGVPLSEFEIRYNDERDEENHDWFTFRLSYSNEILSQSTYWESRRKPQYIMVNGFKVPKPLEFDNGGEVWAPNFIVVDYVSRWVMSSGYREIVISRGIAHATKEAAIAHSKAMLGIDPKWEET